MRNRLLRNWVFGELTGEYLHRQEVPHREPTHIGESLLKVNGEAVNDFGSPSGFLLAGENDFSRVPVGFDNDGIGRKDGTDAGTAEVGLNLLERGGVSLGQ